MDTARDHTAAVVVGYDGSPGSELALDWACEQARLEHRPLEIFHATGSSLRAGELALARAATAADPPSSRRQRSLVEDAAHRVRASAGPDVRTTLHRGGPRAGLLDASLDAALLVVGAKGSGAIEGMLVGSVAQAVAKESSCPVLVVRRSHSTGLHSVLVGTDCTAASDNALAFAFRVASVRSCSLTVLRCFWDATRPVGDVQQDEKGYDQEMAELTASVRPHAERHPEVEPTLALSRGFADRRLVSATHDHDLVVIGHHKMPLLDTVVWGNVTPVVVRHAAGDVAVVPAATSGSRT